MNGPPTFGHEMALHTDSMRTKYGRYPVPDGAEPREGYEDFPIAPLPKWDELTEKQRAMIPMSRADYRKRLRKILEPRQMRLGSSFTRMRRRMRPWKSDMK